MLISSTDPKLPSAATTGSLAFSLPTLPHIPVISTLLEAISEIRKGKNFWQENSLGSAKADEKHDLRKMAQWYMWKPR